jgi:hypothetical protein
MRATFDAERELRSLVGACKALREAASYSKHRFSHEITQSQWAAFCKQLKTAERHDMALRLEVTQ